MISRTTPWVNAHAAGLMPAGQATSDTADQPIGVGAWVAIGILLGFMGLAALTLEGKPTPVYRER